MRPKLIAICGGSGAGKTWLVNRLVKVIPAATHLSLDSFYRDRSMLSHARRERINYDHPRCIDWDLFQTALTELKAGRETFIPTYDFATHARQSTKMAGPTPIILVEGLWLLRKPTVRRLFDLKLFLACSTAQRLGWRLQRDQAERGRTAESIRRQFATSVRPMHDRFVEPQMRFADISICQPLRSADVETMFAALWPLVSGDQIHLAEKREEFGRRMTETLLKEGL